MSENPKSYTTDDDDQVVLEIDWIGMQDSEKPEPQRTEERLRQVHGNGPCHICGEPKAGPGKSICSYPHGQLPVEPIDPGHPNGFWGWEIPK